MNSIRRCNRLLGQRTIKSFTCFNASSNSSFNKNNRNQVYISNDGFNTHNSCNISYNFKTNNALLEINYVNSQLKNLTDHGIDNQNIADCIIIILHFFLGETINPKLFEMLKKSPTFPDLEEDAGLSEDLILKLARVFVHNKSDIYTNENIPTKLLQYFPYDENSNSYSIPYIFLHIFFKLLVAKSKVLTSELYKNYSPLHCIHNTDRDGQCVNGKNFEITSLASMQFLKMLLENEGRIGLKELAPKAIYSKHSKQIMNCNLNEPVNPELLNCLSWLLREKVPNTFQLASSNTQKGIDGVYVCGDVAIFIQCKCSKDENSITDKQIETIITKIEEELIKHKVIGKFKVIKMIITNRKVSPKVQKNVEQGVYGDLVMICKDHCSDNQLQNILMGIERTTKEKFKAIDI